MNLAGSFGVSIDDTQEDALEDQMNYVVRAVASIGIAFRASRDIGSRCTLAVFPSDGSTCPKR
jgi:hypothetical protein